MRLAAAAFAAAVLLAGCGGEAAEPSEDVMVDIVVRNGTVTPQGDRVEMTVSQKVTLHITSDAQEAIHVHSEPEREFEIGAGDDVEKSFTIDTPGQVAVEAHHLDVTILQLVVRP